MGLAESIGINVRKLRKKSNYTLKNLSDKTGLSIALLSRIENGQLSPSVNTLDKIASALGIEISHILQEELSPDQLGLEIAEKIKKRMKIFGISIIELSEKSDIPETMLKRFLKNEIFLSIPNFMRIANILKVDLSYFFQNSHNKNFVISRKDNRTLNEWLGKKGKPNYLVEILFEDFPNQVMEPVISTHVAKEDFLIKASHAGQEFFYVLEGRVKLFLDDHKIILNQGDAIYFDSHLPHAAVSISESPAKTIHTHFAPYSRLKAGATKRV